MKKHFKFARWLVLLLLLIAGFGAMAQTPTTDPDVVCFGETKNYWVVDSLNSTIQWSVSGIGNTFLVSPATGTARITWGAVPGTYQVTIIQTTFGCEGLPYILDVTIEPIPLVDNIIASVCTNNAIGVNLPSTGTNGVGIDSYDISAVVDPGLTGTATTGTGLSGVGVIAGDIFVNNTGGDLDVVYTVIPYAGTCAGSAFTVTVTITSGPTADPIIASVCTNNAIGVNLPATGTNGLGITTYDITAVVDPGLTGTATTGTGLSGVGVIAGDIFVNNTGGDLDVVYTVIPYAGTCAGSAFTVTVTITSGPTAGPIVTTVCPLLAIGVNLPATGSNGLGITTYDITAVVDPGLTGVATTGTGLSGIGVIFNDQFGNISGGDLNVVYTIIPYAGTCAGPAFTVTVTITTQVTTSPIWHD